jgi:hypothetical protein
MKRATGFLIVSIIVGLFACGKGADEVPLTPQLVTAQNSLGFGQEFGSGTYVGTSAQNSLVIQNKGQKDLVISDVQISGDSAFDFEGPDVSTVKSGQSALVTVFFTPPAAGQYQGTLTITSNADNQPTKDIALSGLGIDPPDGGT